MSIEKEALHLRAKLKSTAKLNLEFKAALSKLLREYNVEISDELLSALVISTPDELGNASLATPTLPKPSLPPL